MSGQRRKKANQQQRGAGENLPAPLSTKRNTSPAQQWERVLPHDSQPPEPDDVMRYEELHYFAGPLPPPHVLAQYKDVQQDYPERLLRLVERQTEMAETQATHRQKLETKVVDGGTARSWGGLILGTLIVLFVVACGTYVIMLGYGGYGLAAILTALVGLAGTFVYGLRQQQNQLTQRAREVPEKPEDRR